MKAIEKNISSAVVLGSTGSVGMQTLDVADELGLDIKMLVAGRNTHLLAEQVQKYKPHTVSVADEESAKKLSSELMLRGINTEILYRRDEVLSAIRETEADIIFHSVGGLAGLDYAYAAAESGKRIGMANKEAIIAAGNIIFDKLEKSGGELVPVDSEHSAIYRLLENHDKSDIKSLILTASGGPFFGKTVSELEKVTAKEALAHPTWKMGKKITIDSATLMNKGFEIIEAVRLFGFSEDRVRVVVHPQSIIHSMVEYNDNTVTAQMGRPDMRDCIRYAATAPHSKNATCSSLDFAALAKLTFFEPDNEAFPLMNAARQAVRMGGTAPATLIAADEEAVAEFLGGGIGFTDISSLTLETLENAKVSYNISTESIFAAVEEAREACRKLIGKYASKRV